MTTTEFKNVLKDLTNSDPTLRPFICDGNPVDSKIFIVGINPATQMKSSFWDYYQGEKFNKTKWLDDYIKHRKEKGKTKTLSPTRSKIEKLVQNSFAEYQCLETNVYSKPSSNMKDLGDKDKNTDIFNFLIRSVKPKALFIHGKDPAEFIKNEFNIRFGIGKPIIVEYETKNTVSPLEFELEFGKMAICATRHFISIPMAEIEKAANDLLKLMKK
jgi:hypothetical protein